MNDLLIFIPGFFISFKKLDVSTVQINGQNKKLSKRNFGYSYEQRGSQMQLRRREKEMIECFIKHGLILTAQELAGFANVSTKTIYRGIRKINAVSKQGDIILAEVGKGFRLDYANYLNVADSNFLRVVIETAEENDASAIIAVYPTELDFTKDEFFPVCCQPSKK